SLLYLFLILFFMDTSTTEIYTLSLHDALPIWVHNTVGVKPKAGTRRVCESCDTWTVPASIHTILCIPHPGRIVWIEAGTVQVSRSEEHTSELQSRGHLVCRLLLEKKKKQIDNK